MHSYALPPLPPLEEAKPRSSAVRAGWICIVAGVVTLPLFGFGFILLNVAFILAIVAMATHQIREGIVILFSSIACMIIGWIALFVFVVGGTASLLEQVVADLPKPPKINGQLQSALFPVTQQRPTATRSVQHPTRQLGVEFPQGDGITNQVFDVARACGAKPSELIATFPEAVAAKPGSTIFANNWRGWKSVQMTFNAQNRLTTLIFFTSTPLTEQRAKQLLRDLFQFSPDTSREVRLANGIAYRNIPGPVRMADLHYVENGRLKLVKEFAFYFDLQ